MRQVEVLIAGCGPCGIGAALELEDSAGSSSGRNYLIVDPGTLPGGWASSRQTPEGFTFDCGGHVLFPHKYYPKFVSLLDSLPIDWVASVPKRGVSLDGRFLPYPAQRNLQRLGPAKLLATLASLFLRRLRRMRPHAKLSAELNLAAAPEGGDLESYLLRQFGDYLTSTLMGPLNSKMWAHATSTLSNQWVSLRSGSAQRNVANVSLRQTLRNVLTHQDTPGWTSDTLVTYPARGGSGAIWAAIAARIPAEKLLLGQGIHSIELKEKVATLTSGERVGYKHLISSMPLDTLLRSIVSRPDLHAQASRFVFARSRLFGFGIKGEIAARYQGLHSFHVPDADQPFWRVSLPASVSPGTVPPGCFSVLCEVSEPASRPAQDPAELELRVLAGLHKLGVLDDRQPIVSRFHQTIEHGYPVPFLGRDVLLSEVQSVLEPAGIFSRGRFGAWKYEISNQDHAFMQGIEVVRRLLYRIPEETYTDPHQVNELIEEEPGSEPAMEPCVASSREPLRAAGISLG